MFSCLKCCFSYVEQFERVTLVSSHCCWCCAFISIYNLWWSGVRPVAIACFPLGDSTLISSACSLIMFSRRLVCWLCRQPMDNYIKFPWDCKSNFFETSWSVMYIVHTYMFTVTWLSFADENENPRWWFFLGFRRLRIWFYYFGWLDKSYRLKYIKIAGQVIFVRGQKNSVWFETHDLYFRSRMISQNHVCLTLRKVMAFCGFWYEYIGSKLCNK